MEGRMRILTILFSIFVLMAPQCSHAAGQEGPTLEESVWNMLNPSTFEISVLDDDASIMVALGDSRTVYSRDDIQAHLTSAKASGAKFEASDFKVLSKDESDRFATITYQVTWKTTIGNTTSSTRFTSHEIWERQPSGWRRLFAAMNQ
jgi:hypothetical protein